MFYVAHGESPVTVLTNQEGDKSIAVSQQCRCKCVSRGRITGEKGDGGFDGVPSRLGCQRQLKVVCGILVLRYFVLERSLSGCFVSLDVLSETVFEASVLLRPDTGAERPPSPISLVFVAVSTLVHAPPRRFRNIDKNRVNHRCNTFHRGACTCARLALRRFTISRVIARDVIYASVIATFLCTRVLRNLSVTGIPFILSASWRQAIK